MYNRPIARAGLAAVFSLIPPLAAAQSISVPDTTARDLLLECSERIIRYADWRPTPEPSWSLITYAANGGALYYFGAEHSDEPDHPQFGDLRSAYQDFDPTVVFYEGPSRPLGETADETIRLYGESGFIRYLADRDKIEIERLEPDPGAEMQHVLQQFTIEEAMLFFRPARGLPASRAKGDGGGGDQGAHLRAASTRLVADGHAV